MAGKGKYTTYVPNRDTKPGAKGTSDTNLLEKMYKGAPGAEMPSPPFYGLLRDAAIDVANASGNKYMRAAFAPNNIQAGDPDYFPQGVDMTYRASEKAGNTFTAPNLAEVVWSKPGDPANGYFPDITSPGPGKTDGVDKKDDPNLTPQTLKPFYSKESTPGTVSPVLASVGVYEKNLFKK